FISSEGPGSVLSGFTIQNGFSNSHTPGFGDGGGIRIGTPFSTAPTSPTIQNNIIRNNRACDGVGIMVRSGSPMIQGNTISNNSQAGCSGGTGGGGIGIVGTSNAKILNNIISDNSLTSSDGAGISLIGAGAPTIGANVISRNLAIGILPCNRG